MITHHQKSLLIAVVFLLSFLFTSPLHAQGKIVYLRLWGLPETGEFYGPRESVREFERRNPHIRVILGTPGGLMHLDNQKLMTAIASGKAPDLIFNDRFTISGWVARDAFLPLNELITRDHINLDDYYPGCLKEATYQGKISGLPWGTDVRGLYINREVLRREGIDPNFYPRDWDELLDYAIKLTHRDKRGLYQQLGFAPMYGNAWLYLYGWLNSGQFLTPDGRRCTLNDPRIVEALEWMVKVYDSIGGATAVRGFEQAALTTGIGDPFIAGKLAMVVDGNWHLDHIARNKPDLDFNVVPPPAPKGKEPISWSGGFAWVIPRGAQHVEEAWQLVKFLNSEDGWITAGRLQREYNRKKGHDIFIPLLSANRRINERMRQEFPIEQPNLRIAQEKFITMMEISRSRPASPVGQQLWDGQARATDLALLGVKTPRKALDDETYKVQKDLNRIYHPPDYPEINILIITRTITLFLTALLFLGGFLMLRKVWHHRRRRKETIAGILFASPWLLGFLIFLLGPMIFSLVLSFCEYDVLHPVKFVGLHNFQTILGFEVVEAKAQPQDPLFWKSLWNTFYLTFFGVPIGLLVGLGMALILAAEIRGVAIYRTFFYLPAIVPIVATAVLWLWLLNPQMGLLNNILNRLLGWTGFTAPNWLEDPNFSRPAVILMLAWTSGAAMIIWLAGLKSIPAQLYEAVEIDGGSWTAKFFKVTIPLLTPYIFFNLVMGIIGYLQIFTQAYILTVPPHIGPNDTLLFYVYYLFIAGFSYFKLGYASAMAWFLFLIIFMLTWIQLRLAPRWVHYE